MQQSKLVFIILISLFIAPSCIALADSEKPENPAVSEDSEEKPEFTIEELDQMLADLKEIMGSLDISDAVHAKNPEDINVSPEPMSFDKKTEEELRNLDL